MASVNDVKEYLGLTEDETEAEAFISACLEEAVLLVDKYVGEVPVPEAILDRAYIRAAVNQYNLRQAPNGMMNQQFVSADGIPAAPVRITSDPLRGVTEILRRWVGVW